MIDTGAQAARILIDTKAVLVNAREPFTYTSGKKGPVYVDCRRLISFPDARGRLMDMGASMIRKSCPDIEYVAGGETAGIPYAAFISDRLDLPMLYVRKKPKGFGRMAQIEGHMEETGKRVLIVEDVQNYGVSVKIFVDALRAAGALVEHIFVIFQHGHESSRKSMEEMGVKLHALCSWQDVLKEARRGGDYDNATLDAI
jgi:orotate phosphoribosyltransferase